MKKKIMILALSAGLCSIVQASDQEDIFNRAPKSFQLINFLDVEDAHINQVKEIYEVNGVVGSHQNHTLKSVEKEDIVFINETNTDFQYDDSKSLSQKKIKSKKQKDPVFQYKISKKVSVSYKTNAGKKALDIYKKYSEEASDRLDKIMNAGLWNINYSKEIEGYKTESKVVIPNEICEFLDEEFDKEEKKFFISIMFLNNYKDVLEEKFLRIEENPEDLQHFVESIQLIRNELNDYQY